MNKTLPLLLLAFLGLPAGAEMVCANHDGDTIKLCSGQSIRLFGIDAPELKQPLGRESRDYLHHLVVGQNVKLLCKGESFKRKVCRVYRDKLDVQREMVGRGWAFDSALYSGGAYRDAEAFARGQARGVWQQPGGGRKPWDFRHR